MNLERKERLRRLALETIDLNKDPYFMRNHLGRLLLLLFAAAQVATSPASLVALVAAPLARV